MASLQNVARRWGDVLPVPAWSAPVVLSMFGAALWLLMVPAGLAMVLDDRTVDGALVWVKPLKFLASLGLFSLTTAWVLSHIEPHVQRGRVAQVVVALVVVCSGFELTYIAWQAAQAKASHFNTQDSFYALMYTLMGVAAVVLTATSAAVAWLVARHALPWVSPALWWALVLGSLLTVVLGIFTGAAMSTQPGHFVGHPPGAATLPLLGWSWQGGDYRVAHFLGLHTHQVLPVVGLLAQRFQARIGRHGAVCLVWVAAGGWTAWVVLAFSQARNGLPFHAL